MALLPDFERLKPDHRDHVSTNLRINDWVEEYILVALKRARYYALGKDFLLQSLVNEYKAPHAWKLLTAQMRLKVANELLHRLALNKTVTFRPAFGTDGKGPVGMQITLTDPKIINKPFHSKDFRQATVTSVIKRITYYATFAMAAADDAAGFTKWVVYLIKTIQENKLYEGLDENFEAAKRFAKTNNMSQGVTDTIISTNRMAQKQDFVKLKAAARVFRGDYTSEDINKTGKQTGLTGSQKIIIDEAMKYLNTGSLTAMSTIGQKISTLKDPNLSRLFNVELKIKEGMNEGAAIKILKKHSGDDLILDPKETKALSDAKDGRYDEYRDARDFLRSRLREQVAKLVRSTGEEIDGELLLPIADLRKALPDTYKKLLPKGIEKLKLNDRYELFSPEGKAIASGGKAYQPVIGTEYKLSTSFKTSKRANPAYLQYTNNVGESQSLYLLELKQKTQTKRQEQAGEIMDNLPTIKKKVVADLSSKDEATKRLATITALMLFLASRVGSLGNKTGDEETYGTSTLQVRHVSKKDTDIIIKYSGKSGMSQVQVLTPEMIGNKETWKKIKNNIIAFRADKSPTDYLFAEADGKPPSNTEINKYFRSKGIAGSVHKIRHAIANYYFNEFKSDTKFTEQKKAFEAFKVTMTKVGEKLGHKKSTSDGEEVNVWQTAAKSYVDKSVQKQFFDENNLMVPKLLEAMWI